MNAMRELTVGAALEEYRRLNNLPADDATARSWTFGLGPATIRLPNFRWRRKAILAHDLHHLLTDYPCTLRGECQMAAWEFGAGPMPHWAARWFCLPLVPLGLLWSPRRMYAAFIAGRRSRSLHNAVIGEELLDTRLDRARAYYAAGAVSGGSGRDAATFAGLVLQGSMITLALPLTAGACCALIVALLR